MEGQEMGQIRKRRSKKKNAGEKKEVGFKME